ncbi:MAG TPA: isochorismatase family protein [Myxococcota bacterium]|jgi:nicotinamidase/pyrazinamidase
MTLGILLVDPQYDFFPGGSLAVADGDKIVDPLNELMRRHPNAPVYASRDWHPSSTKHFKERGGIWPPHCVQGTRGAAFHSGLDMQRARVFSKGMNPEDDAGYSAFEAVREPSEAGGKPISLADDLHADHVDTLLVAGLATDYCVKASVLDSLKNGFTTLLYRPGVRPVNLKPDDGDKAIEEMKAARALVVE